jgi:hypothetical protein
VVAAGGTGGESAVRYVASVKAEVAGPATVRSSPR